MRISLALIPSLSIYISISLPSPLLPSSSPLSSLSFFLRCGELWVPFSSGWPQTHYVPEDDPELPISPFTLTSTMPSLRCPMYVALGLASCMPREQATHWAISPVSNHFLFWIKYLLPQSSHPSQGCINGTQQAALCTIGGFLSGVSGLVPSPPQPCALR